MGGGGVGQILVLKVFIADCGSNATDQGADPTRFVLPLAAS